MCCHVGSRHLTGSQASVPLRGKRSCWRKPLSRDLPKGTREAQRVPLLRRRRILPHSREGARQKPSIPAWGHARRGQRAPGQKSLGTAQSLRQRPGPSTLRPDQGKSSARDSGEHLGWASHCIPWPPCSSAPPPWPCPRLSCLGCQGRW